jgi:hypothetical protein
MQTSQHPPIHWTEASKNGKTGSMLVSTTGKQSCAISCPMAEACYAKQGPLNLHWDKVTTGERDKTWPAFLRRIATLPDGAIWRHNQAGDLPHSFGEIVRSLTIALARANRGKRGFTYTHHPLHGDSTTAIHNRVTVKRAQRLGFTINASCESEAQADSAIQAGILATMEVPSTESRLGWRTAGGNVVRRCPAQLLPKGAVTCDRCQLCQDRPAHHIIAFSPDGKTAKRVNAALAAG